MPHTRIRFVRPQVLKFLKQSPLVGILGQRQTGKTTLIQSIAGSHYVSLDDPGFLSAAQTHPKGFLLDRKAPFAIDECQLAPELFPALKLHVQNHGSRGQFILTGSVRFTARKAIRESLTGRIQILELHPLTYAEAQSRALPHLMERLTGSIDRFKSSALKQSPAISLEKAIKYLETGGLPGICFMRDESSRRPRLSSHIDTILGRDLPLVLQTTHPLLRLRELLTALAQDQGRPLSLSELSRRVQISTASLIKLLHAFEGLFLIRRVLPLGDSKKDAFYLEDQGTATYLSGHVSDSFSGANLERFLYSQLYPHLDLHDPGGVTAYHYTTRNGARVPLVFKTFGQLIGMIPIAAETPDKKSLASAESFLKSNRSARVLILSTGSDCLAYHPRLWVVPIASVI